MSEAVQVIRREIAKREAEIEALQLALKALTGSATRSKPKQPSTPVPKADPEGNFTVNGTDLHLGRRELAVIEAIAAAEDCIPAEQLTPLCKDKRLYVQQTVSTLNKKLKAAGAHIVHFKGHGYRLQNIEEGA